VRDNERAPDERRGRRLAPLAEARAHGAHDVRLVALPATGAEDRRADALSTTCRLACCAITSTGCRSSMPGSCTAVSGILSDPVVGEAASNLFADATRRARPASSTKTGCRRRPCSASSRRTARTTTSWSTPTTRGQRRAAPVSTCASSGRSPRAQPQQCLADFVAPVQLGRADLHWRVRGDGRHRHRRARGALRAPSTTTTTRSSSRRWPTASPRPSPSTCTSACAASTGATRRRAAGQRRADPANSIAGIRPAPGYPACPDHTEKDKRCSQLLGVESAPGPDLDRVLRDAADGVGQRLLFQRIPTVALFRRWARSTATRSSPTPTTPDTGGVTPDTGGTTPDLMVDSGGQTCTACHGTPPSTGKHTLHNNFKCSSCHSDVVDANNNIISTHAAQKRQQGRQGRLHLG
jgi:hypothetical protein